MLFKLTSTMLFYWLVIMLLTRMLFCYFCYFVISTIQSSFYFSHVSEICAFLVFSSKASAYFSKVCYSSPPVYKVPCYFALCAICYFSVFSSKVPAISLFVLFKSSPAISYSTPHRSAICAISSHFAILLLVLK